MRNVCKNLLLINGKVKEEKLISKIIKNLFNLVRN